MKPSVVTNQGFILDWVRQVGADGGSYWKQRYAGRVLRVPSSQLMGAMCSYLVGRVDPDAVIVGTDQNSTGGTDMFIVQLEAG